MVNKIPDNTYFRLRVVTFDNVPWVATMKKNEHYFPTVEFHKESGEWKRRTFGEEGTEGLGGALGGDAGPEGNVVEVEPTD